MPETHSNKTSDSTIDHSGRMPVALMLFGEDKVTPVGYCLMQGDQEISRGSFPTNIHTGSDRYNFLQRIQGTAQEQWSRVPKKAKDSSQKRVRLGSVTQEMRKYLGAIVESLSPATWEAMT